MVCGAVHDTAPVIFDGLQDGELLRGSGTMVPGSLDKEPAIEQWSITGGGLWIGLCLMAPASVVVIGVVTNPAARHFLWEEPLPTTIALLCAMAGLALCLYREWVQVDRANRRITLSWGVLVPWRSSSYDLDRFKAVEVACHGKEHVGDAYIAPAHYVYRVVLVAKGFGPVSSNDLVIQEFLAPPVLARRTHRCAARAGERIARATNLPLLSDYDAQRQFF